MPLNFNLTLAPAGQSHYIEGAGAKSSAGRGNPNYHHRRTSATIPAGAFFVPAVRVMAGCAGQASAWPVPCDIGFPPPCNPSPVVWKQLLTVPTNHRSRNHAHKHPYPRTPEAPAISLALDRTRKPPVLPSDCRSDPGPSPEDRQPFLPRPGHTAPLSFSHLNAARQLLR